MNYTEKIILILKWAKDNPSFCTQFVKSVLKVCQDGKKLSGAQQMAVDTIIDKWCIDIPGLKNDMDSAKIIPLFETINSNDEICKQKDIKQTKLTKKELENRQQIIDDIREMMSAKCRGLNS